MNDGRSTSAGDGGDDWVTAHSRLGSAGHDDRLLEEEQTKDIVARFPEGGSHGFRKVVSTRCVGAQAEPLP
ncbi:hypothetical protein MDOR_09330 [Mycolicibacterium doricum]|uniref:Uncharacterized protein n=1 Tax=Mycolicibacterium doricum TaxID=126673 RepID=A0A7I7VNC9_9MYCO|nr:hypothetical protein MDOR_09330 [Mycolicibacterium doricum]